MKYLLAILLILTQHVFSQQAEVLYKTYCAGCHGGRMEGSSAPPLIKNKWLHGSSNGALYKTIQAGIPKSEMKGWGGVLKSDQINTLVDYIQASQNGLKKQAAVLPPVIRTADYLLKVERIDSGHTATPWAIEFVNPR